MRRFILVFVFFAYLFWCNSPGFALEQKGMALGLFSKDPSYSYLNDLREMKEAGVTHVLMVISWYQKNVKANEIVPKEYDGNDILTLPDSKLSEIIDQAHKLEMKVFLFPILRLEERQNNDWRGILKPSEPETWWKSYENFILHYARLGAEKKIEILSVGSELLSFEKETVRWRKLIRKVREVFPGKLTYSANWDHYQHPQFWKQLDFIGMTAYHELVQVEVKKPSLKLLTQKWRSIRNQILKWKRQFPKQPLLITEIGYPSINGAASQPWNYFLEGSSDVEEQALCYRAFIRVWKHSKSLKGNYFWVWWGQGGGKDNSYTPRGKPALQYVKEWYRSR